ncbi:MAG: glycine zipper family protein [Proteobacteria bacterium]|nr:glycine zipper family protein [Pseudomonadota bacterium]
MAKPPYAPDSLGKFRRRYDEVNENSPGGTDEVLEVLKWMQEPVMEHNTEDKGNKNKLHELLDAGLALEQADKVQAISALKNAKMKGSALEKLTSVLKDIYYAGKDITSSNRVKTSLIIVAGIAIGAAVGAVLGTVVFPGIGSAIGGALGAALVSGVAAVGGAVGLSIFGAFVGSWLGKIVGKKLFKHEKRFEISKRNTGKIKQRIGLSNSVSQMINGYLYNRAKAVQSPLCKKYYKSLRRLAIEEASPTGMEKVSRFFCSELGLLQKERSVNNNSPELQREIEAVVYILQKLRAADHLSSASKKRIDEALSAYDAKLSKVHEPRQGIVYDNAEELSADTIANSNKLFLATLPDSVKSVTSENKKSNSGAISYRYHVKTNTGMELPEVVFKSKKDSAKHSLTKVTVKSSQVNKDNQKQVAEVIVAQAKAHFASTGKREVIVLAAGNDDLAIELMVAVQKAGLKPKLSPREYPEHDEKAQARKQNILAKVQALSSSAERLALKK